MNNSDHSVTTKAPSMVFPMHNPPHQSVFSDPKGDAAVQNRPWNNDDYGKLVMAGIISVVIIFAAVTTLVIFCTVQKLEQRKRHKQKEQQNNKGKHLAAAVPCYKWDPMNHNGALNHGTSGVSSSSYTNTIITAQEGLSSVDASSSGDIYDVEQPLPEKGSKDDYHFYCAVCSVSFENGIRVYESNNPKCRHIFHQNCMDKWLNHQNTCPICNEIYALQYV